MIFDTSRLGAWGALPFFTDALPDIAARVAAEPGPVYPPPAQVFRALELCQPADCRVVIIGQDPYHTPAKADGLAFSIQSGFTGNLASLGNIFKELQSDLNVTRTRTELDDWAAQGVLLLNTALTVPEGRAHAHAKIGWSALITQVLAHLSDRPRAYLLWGAHAQKTARSVDAATNLKIETVHPSPLSVHRGFFGSRPFSKVNRWLMERGEAEIDWAGT